jgi:hypothetical protein
MAKFHQGKYKPKKPEKYTGDPTDIIYRSSWELKFMNWCDRTNSVIRWSSESTVIPYRCGTDNKIHRYFVDFKIEVKTIDGSTKTYLVEVKPLTQTMPPVYPGKKTRRYITEALTFVKNQSKWEAAINYCKDRKWEFKIITEKELNL